MEMEKCKWEWMCGQKKKVWNGNGFWVKEFDEMDAHMSIQPAHLMVLMDKRPISTKLKKIFN